MRTIVTKPLSHHLAPLVFLLFLPLLMGLELKTENDNHTVTITVSNIRNTKGSLQFQVYRDQTNFAAENPYKTYRVSKSKVENRKLTYEIKGLPTDWYGIALLDDENNDKKMDYGLIMPSEGFGFSDYYHTAWSRPVFNQFKFELKSNKSISIKVRYV